MFKLLKEKLKKMEILDDDEDEYTSFSSLEDDINNGIKEKIIS